LIKKISIDQLKVGMYITDMSNQWIPDGNSSRKGTIKSQVNIDKIKQLGVSTIHIDTSKGVDCPDVASLGKKEQLQKEQLATIQQQSGVDNSNVTVNADGRVSDRADDRESAEKAHAQAKDIIGDVLGDVKNGKGVDAKIVSAMAEELTDSLDKNSSALACLTRIRAKDTYLLEHSVNVGILLGLFARSMKVERKIVAELVTGGLLHDIGKIIVPDEVLNKPGKLESEEWVEMQRHVTYGEQVLDVTEGLSDLSRSICALHHERLDGSGYPRKLAAENISQYGRMAAVVDVYDAITADRVYHQGMSPNEALKKLIEWSVFHLDKDLVYGFIRCVSIYPVGTLVELDNGRAGVVIEINAAEPKKPLLRVFYDMKAKCKTPPYLQDLASRINKNKIVATLDARQLQINEMEFM